MFLLIEGPGLWSLDSLLGRGLTRINTDLIRENPGKAVVAS
jgi:hypothetical protein